MLKNDDVKDEAVKTMRRRKLLYKEHCDYGYDGVCKTKDVDESNFGSKDGDDGNSRSKGDDEHG